MRCELCEAGEPLRPTANGVDYYHLAGDPHGDGVRSIRCPSRSVDLARGGEHEEWDRRRSEWSASAFPGRGPCGPMLHLLKEVLTELLTSDSQEWASASASIYKLVEALVRRDVSAFPIDELADLEFLVQDARSRSGHTYGQLLDELWRKLAVNQARRWPQGADDGRPVEHER